MHDAALILVGAALAGNLVMHGAVPLSLDATRRQAVTAFAMLAGAVVAITGVLAWALQTWVLIPLALDYLQTFALVSIAAAVASVAMVTVRLRGASVATLAARQPANALGVLLLTSFAVLGAVVAPAQPDLWRAAMQSVGAGIGITVALVLFAAMRERLEGADVPAAFRGAPILLVTAALMALALLGLAGPGSD